PLPREALGALAHRPEPAADGAARAAEGELRRAAVPAAGADRAGRVEALRDDGRRQRRRLVHHRRAQPRVGERPAAPPRPREGLRLRCGRHLEAATLNRAESVTTPPQPPFTAPPGDSPRACPAGTRPTRRLSARRGRPSSPTVRGRRLREASTTSRGRRPRAASSTGPAAPPGGGTPGRGPSLRR